MTSNPFEHFISLWILSLAALPVYWSIRNVLFRESLLTVVGMYLVYITGPRFLLFWLVYWFLVWAACRVLERTQQDRSRRSLLWLSVALIILPIVLWKLYGDTALLPVNEFFHNIVIQIRYLMSVDSLESLILVPLGLSYTAFRALELVVTVYVGLAKPPNLRRVMFFAFFPAVLVLGPIIQMSELDKTEDANAAGSHVMYGLYRAIIGLLKLFILARPLAYSQDMIIGHEDYASGELWMAVFVHGWYMYFNFSAYSDLAIASARLYGYRISENFAFPFFRQDLQQLWSNWHMSLTGLAQRVVFIPLGGYRHRRQYFAIFCTMMVIALWHDISIPLVFYGVVHGCGLLLIRWRANRRGPDAAKPGTPRQLLNMAMTFSYFCTALPLLLLNTQEAFSFYPRLFLGTIAP